MDSSISCTRGSNWHRNKDAEKNMKISEMKNNLVDFAIKALMAMYDEENKLFYYKQKYTRDGLKNVGLSYRYSLISYLGISKYMTRNEFKKIELDKVCTRLFQNANTIDNIGDLGLLIWFGSLINSQLSCNIISEMDKEVLFESYNDSIERNSMELSWFLTGLCHYILESGDFSKNIVDLANYTYELIKRNYLGNGIFCHAYSKNFIRKLRNNIGSFADQVYPIYAFCQYYKTFKAEETKNIVSECALNLCKHQGVLGQWWWHYNASTGKIFSNYPVYAVHQDGMAPMALYEVQRYVGLDLNDSINLGIKWIYGNNELGENMLDNELKVIWRSINLKSSRKYVNDFKSIFNFGSVNGRGLYLNYECRPYHLGWILYSL